MNLLLSLRRARSLFLGAALLAAPALSRGQTAFGIDASGSLFRFDLAAPATTTTVGNVGFVPEGLDFLSGSALLYALDVGPTVARLYTINTSTGAATAIGSGFALTGSVSGVNYDLTGATSYGFDFNPTTLQADSSIRIRLTANTGANLRLNSATGGIAAVDGALTAGSSIGASAYINNAAATQGGATALYNIDFGSDRLVLQNPPNNGTLVDVGPLGVAINGSVAFDIYTTPGSTDATVGGDAAYLVNTTGVGSASLYSVNLSTGAATPLSTLNRDFTGGFAVAPGAVPEPAHFGAGAALLLGALAWVRHRRANRR